MSIGKRSMLIMVVIILTVVITNSAVMFLNTRSAIIMQAEEKSLSVIKTFEATINESSKNISESDYEKLLQNNLNDLKNSLPEILDFTIYKIDSTQKAFASTSSDKIGKQADPEDITAAQEDKAVTIVSNYGNEDVEVDVTAPVKVQGQIKYVAGVTYSIKDEMIAINNLLIKLILISIGTILIAMLFMWISYVRPMSRQLLRLKAITDEVSSGNLDLEIKVNSKDEIGALETNFNMMVSVLRNLVSQIQTLSLKVVTISENIKLEMEDTAQTVEYMAISSNDIANGNTKQSETIAEVSKRVSEVADGLKAVTQNISASKTITTNASGIVAEGMLSIDEQKLKMNESKETVQRTSKAIVELDRQSGEVSAIVDVITQIADQINLLALNAAIEAARAGENGRGFSVVADEVRKLAEQSRRSTEEIYHIVNEIQTNSKNVVTQIVKSKDAIDDQEKVVETTIEKFYSIEKAVTQLSNNITIISTEAEHLTLEASHVKENINEVALIAKASIEDTNKLSSGSEAQSTTVKKVLKVAVELTDIVSKLRESTQKFKL
jgi:methyl-accepting chemotaxis protein